MYEGKDYEVKSAYDTIKRYQEIMEDESLMKKVEEYAEKEMEKISSIADLKKAYTRSVEREDSPAKSDSKFKARVDKARDDNEEANAMEDAAHSGRIL